MKGVDSMGQASVDLPDPLEMPGASGLAGTDDLLAQLAGDEIDRLLAEAQEENPPPAPPAASAGTAPVAASAPAAATTVDPQTSSAPDPSAAPATPKVDELDALLNEIN